MTRTVFYILIVMTLLFGAIATGIGFDEPFVSNILSILALACGSASVILKSITLVQTLTSELEKAQKFQNFVLTSLTKDEQEETSFKPLDEKK